MNETGISYQKILIIGAGASGRGAARLLTAAGKELRVSTDGMLSKEDHALFSTLGALTEEGGHSDVFVQWADACVLSPGVKPDSAVVNKICRTGRPILTEVDTACALNAGSWIAVTGSNGKTSTSTLLAQILSHHATADLCGNIGKSFSESVLENKNCCRVVELSSFQLKFSERISPDVSIILNLSPNHLNWHADLDDYYESKVSLVQKTKKSGISILNYDDPEIRLRVKKNNSRQVWFSCANEGADYFLKGGQVLRHSPHGVQNTGIVLPVDNARMPSENYLAAAVCAVESGIDTSVISRCLAQFSSLKHRVQPVGSVRGVSFINDSKSTTEASTMQALKFCGKDIILLAGGVLKVREFNALRKMISGHVSKAIFFGSGKDELYSIFSDVVPSEKCETLANAFEQACLTAGAGQTVLLSPMCASFDQFKSFEERGDVFIELALEEIKSHSPA